MPKQTRPIMDAAYIAARIRGVPQVDLTEMSASFRPAIEAAFATANGRATSFSLGYSDAVDLAIETEQRLEKLGVAKALRGGAIVTRSSSGPSANAYKYAAIGTSFSLRRNNRGDYILENVRRISVHPKEAGRWHLTVTQAALDAITRSALAGISAHQPVAIAA